MPNIKFINYDGAWPCLCYGTLIFEVNGKTYSLDNCLSSGGGVWFDDDWNEEVESGPWNINDLPDELEQYRDAIIAMVNESVPWGCCGGCV